MNRISTSVALFSLLLLPHSAWGVISLPVAKGGFEDTAPLALPNGWTVAEGSNPFWVGDTSLAGADGDGDGQVTQNDYELWRVNFGAVLSTSPSQANQGVGVPEPGAAATILLSLTSLAFKHKHFKLSTSK